MWCVNAMEMYYDFNVQSASKKLNITYEEAERAQNKVKHNKGKL